MSRGTANTLVRSNYWIPKERQLFKSIIEQYNTYQKYLFRFVDQITSLLTSDRMSEALSISVCRLDFAGPIYVYTCNITRVLHLERVSNMSTELFLSAFR